MAQLRNLLDCEKLGVDPVLCYQYALAIETKDPRSAPLFAGTAGLRMLKYGSDWYKSISGNPEKDQAVYDRTKAFDRDKAAEAWKATRDISFLFPGVFSINGWYKNGSFHRPYSDKVNVLCESVGDPIKAAGVFWSDGDILVSGVQKKTLIVARRLRDVAPKGLTTLVRGPCVLVYPWMKHECVVPVSHMIVFP